mgnify:CR=1 FL=1
MERCYCSLRSGGIVISKKTNYEKKLNPIYVESMEASHIYINDCAKKADKKAECKIGNKWVEFNGISTRKAVLTDSLFLRYMNSSIVRDSTDNCKDFVVVKFTYNAEYKMCGIEEKVDKHDLRTLYYKNGVNYTFEKKNKKGEVVDTHTIHYKMLMRSPGKAKKGECVFIRENLHHKAINFLTMGLYDLMEEQSKHDPDKVFKLVELSAYQTLTTATALQGYIRIPLENILIVKDKEVYSDGMRAAIVKNEDARHVTKGEFELDFESPKLESIINKKGFTLDKSKAEQNPELTLIKEKTKKALKENGIRINGRYPGFHPKVVTVNKECTVRMTADERIKNILWDGMGLIDESYFPENTEGFIYCRSHFFKSCLFRGSIQEFFKDYCRENNLDYETYTVEEADMFHRKIRLCDIKVIITDKSIKWTKFIDMMGGTEQEAYNYYRKWMKKQGDYFSIVKSAHQSKWGNYQLMAYQMDNSLPSTNEETLGHVSKHAVDIINKLKESDTAYLKYLEMQKDGFNINEALLKLVEWNADFSKTEFFRTKKSKDISSLKEDFCEGRLPQVGDNLTIMDNPISLLLTAVGDKDPLDERCFGLTGDGVQCYTPRFRAGERLAAFRSPHNSPNNIIHLHNVYPNKLIRYFPNIGQNVIVFNAIKTDTQARLSGHDCDSDFVYVTNQHDLADFARKAYTEYPTIINKIDELGTSNYHFTLEDYARMDNTISDAQESIGTSTDTAQLALSYYYDGDMQNKELEKCFIILSVIGQISIDLAKKTFDIDTVKEINRIKRLPCMSKKEIPRFFAATKKQRNSKEYDKKMIRSMKCPMDIMADNIEKNVIKYAPRESHIMFRDLLNKSIKGSGIRYKKEKVILEAKQYNKTDKWIESHRNCLDKNTYFSLRQKAISQFLYKADNNLDQETIMQLVIFAIRNDNSDICASIFNFLYRNYREEFLNCFIKK